MTANFRHSGDRKNYTTRRINEAIEGRNKNGLTEKLVVQVTTSTKAAKAKDNGSKATKAARQQRQ